MKFIKDALDLICTAILVVGIVVSFPLALLVLSGNPNTLAVALGLGFAVIISNAWLQRKGAGE